MGICQLNETALHVGARYPTHNETFFAIYADLVLCGCETRSLTLREQRKLGVFENMMMRERVNILRTNRENITGGWRKLHNEELQQIL
jgi:hypothetical protein